MGPGEPEDGERSIGPCLSGVVVEKTARHAPGSGPARAQQASRTTPAGIPHRVGKHRYTGASAFSSPVLYGRGGAHRGRGGR